MSPTDPLAVFVPINDILTERVRQDVKWGEQNHDAERWMLILGEEYGEAQKAALELTVAVERKPLDAAKVVRFVGEYRRELVQVAAVALAAIECLDRNTGSGEERP